MDLSPGCPKRAGFSFGSKGQSQKGRLKIDTQVCMLGLEDQLSDVVVTLALQGHLSHREEQQGVPGIPSQNEHA